MTVQFGEEVSWLEDDSFQIAARMLDTVVAFLPPNVNHASWRIASGDFDEDEALVEIDDEPAGWDLDVLGDVPAAAVIDVVPFAAEAFVVEITREAAEFYEEAPDEDTASHEAARRLLSEWEQAEAHSAGWQRRATARYGGVRMYEFPPDAELEYELGEEDGQPALFICHNRLRRVLVAPDTRQPWRYSKAGSVDEYGERLTVPEALERAGDQQAPWVRDQTSLALGATLAEMRAMHDLAVSGRDPRALQSLAELAGHAQTLAEGLQPPLVA